ncbi:hypothetical protein RISK_004837 [Rhodopirellula islandica]|uniref:Uncharacterized protein n=1 Tax=Rhodopirellula islandica TaxID=595434 RepID=A0A0J1B9C6_RHOIS|nr:hypothetical protein RISK_004837 [Rhodopirellula islandica]
MNVEVFPVAMLASADEGVVRELGHVLPNNASELSIQPAFDSLCEP